MKRDKLIAIEIISRLEVIFILSFLLIRACSLKDHTLLNEITNYLNGHLARD